MATAVYDSETNCIQKMVSEVLKTIGIPEHSQEWHVTMDYCLKVFTDCVLNKADLEMLAGAFWDGYRCAEQAIENINKAAGGK